MISYLKGNIIIKKDNYVIINVANVGYKVFMNSSMISEIEIEGEYEIFTHHNVKEDASDLYGFRSIEELDMFKLLLSISGVGPKSALNVLGIAGLHELKSSIANGDPSLLEKVSGIGKKTAERVVLELRGKIDKLDIGTGQFSSGVKPVDSASDEIDALMALGYSMQQARDALRRVDNSIVDSGERIREALKQLG